MEIVIKLLSYKEVIKNMQPKYMQKYLLQRYIRQMHIINSNKIVYFEFHDSDSICHPFLIFKCISYDLSF